MRHGKAHIPLGTIARLGLRLSFTEVTFCYAPLPNFNPSLNTNLIISWLKSANHNKIQNMRALIMSFKFFNENLTAKIQTKCQEASKLRKSDLHKLIKEAQSRHSLVDDTLQSIAFGTVIGIIPALIADKVRDTEGRFKEIWGFCKEDVSTLEVLKNIFNDKTHGGNKRSAKYFIASQITKMEPTNNKTAEKLVQLVKDNLNCQLQVIEEANNTTNNTRENINLKRK